MLPRIQKKSVTRGAQPPRNPRSSEARDKTSSIFGLTNRNLLTWERRLATSAQCSPLLGAQETCNPPQGFQNQPPKNLHQRTTAPSMPSSPVRAEQWDGGSGTNTETTEGSAVKLGSYLTPADVNGARLTMKRSGVTRSVTVAENKVQNS